MGINQTHKKLKSVNQVYKKLIGVVFAYSCII